MSYMTISSQENHHFSLCSYFHAHPTTLLLKILGGPIHGPSPTLQITTAALVALLHHTTEMLKTHDYVAIIGTDYSKAFDTARHYTLAQILNNLHLPGNLYNRFVNYYTKRGHVTRFQGGWWPSVAYINASVVQGSVVGLASFITCVSTPCLKINCTKCLC